MSFPIYRHDTSWDAWFGAANDNDTRWSTAKSPSRWKRRRSGDPSNADSSLDTIDALATTSEPADEIAEPSETPERASFWKRERSFGRRKSDDDVQEDEVELELSWWSRRSDEAQVTADDSAAHPGHGEDEGVDVSAGDEPAPAAEKPSIWKRELSFGRKNGDAVAEPAVDAEQAPEAFGEPVVSEQYEVGRDEAEDVSAADELAPATEKPSIWKRDLSFGRKTEEGNDVAVPAVDAEQAPEALDVPIHSAPDDARDDEIPAAAELAPTAEQPSIWKRDLSFGHETENGDAVAEPEPEAFAVTAGSEHYTGLEPSANDDIASTEASDETAEPVGWWPQSPSAAAAWPSAEDEAPSAEAESSTFSWQLDETPNEVVDHVAPDWSRPAEPEVAAHEDPVDDSQVEADERIPAAEKQSIWKRELSFGRRGARSADDSQLDRSDAGHVPDSDEPHHPAEPAEYGEPAFDETPLPVPFAETPAPELDSEPVAHDAPAEDEPAPSGKTRRRSSLGRNRGPRKPKAPAAAKASTLAKGGKKLVGLKIGASQIAAAYVHSNGSHEVLKLARTPLERGVVVSGELRDPDALAVALKTFFNENKLPKRNIRLGIASNRVGVRVLDVPGVEDPALLGNAVRFRAQEVLPIPLSEAVLDYRVLRERFDDEGNPIREVLVAFAYRELVDRYAEVCRSAGLRLMGIDLDGFALLRALVDPAASSSRLGGAAVVTVALGHDRSIMSISNGDACEFTRVIDWGGASLDTAVARILALTPSQAEPIKRQLTLDSTMPSPEGLEPEQASRARSAMAQEVRAFAREFVSSLQFYQSQPRSLDIGEIVLTGGMAHMAGLAQQLQELIGVTVRIGDPLGRVKVGKHVDTEEAIGSFALAIGLGIED